MQTQFDNMTDIDLADRIGEINAQTKALTKTLEVAKGEFKARGHAKIEGDSFTITRSETVRWSLNQAAINETMGEAWVVKHSRTTPVLSLRITAQVAALAVN